MICIAIMSILSFWTGKKIEHEIPIWQTELTDICLQHAASENFNSNWCEIKIINQKRHWFSTDLTIAVDDKIQMLTIYHGPFSLSAIKKGILSPQMSVAILESAENSTDDNTNFLIRGVASLSYLQTLKFNFEILPFEQFFETKSAAQNLHIENNKTTINGLVDLKSDNRFKLNIVGDDFSINSNPIKQLNLAIDYHKNDDQLEQLSLNFVQSSLQGNLNVNAEISSSSLERLFELIQQNPNQVSQKILKLIDFASFNLKGTDENIAYLWLITQDKISVSTQDILDSTIKLDQLYKQLNFNQRLFIDQYQNEYIVNFELNSKKETLTINGTNLPFKIYD